MKMKNNRKKEVHISIMNMKYTSIMVKWVCVRSWIFVGEITRQSILSKNNYIFAIVQSRCHFSTNSDEYLIW